jgi:hypothetical protein
MRSRIARKIVKKAAAKTAKYSPGKVSKAQQYVSARERRKPQGNQ